MGVVFPQECTLRELRVRKMDTSALLAMIIPHTRYGVERQVGKFDIVPIS